MNDKKTPDFPFEIFPKEITSYIKKVASTQSFSEDFLAIAFMSAVATIIGNKIQYQTPKKTWMEKPIFWMAIVGNPSVGKTPALKTMLKPIQKESNRLAKIYNEEITFYNALSPEQKKVNDKPLRNDFILPDATIEKMADIHSDNKRGVLLFKDEFISWINSMGEYKSGKNSERQKYLETFNGSILQVDRVRSEKITIIENTCVNIIGGIQESKLEGFLNEENQGDGFSARILFAYPKAKIGFLTDEDLDQEALDWYNESFDVLFSEINSLKESKILYTEEEGKYSFFEYFNEFVTDLADEEIPEHIKYFIGKKRTYLPRFALLLAIINNYFGNNQKVLLEKVTKENLDNSFRLLDYFSKMNSKVNEVYNKGEELNKALNGKETKTDQIKKLLNSEQFKNKEISQKDIAKKIGCSGSFVTKIKRQLFPQTGTDITLNALDNI